MGIIVEKTHDTVTEIGVLVKVFFDMGAHIACPDDEGLAGVFAMSAEETYQLGQQVIDRHITDKKDKQEAHKMHPRIAVGYAQHNIKDTKRAYKLEVRFQMTFETQLHAVMEVKIIYLVF